MTQRQNESGHEEPIEDRLFIVERVFDAPAALLFEAYSTPEHLMRWYGPEDYPLTMCEVDFRVGGTYRFAMTGPDGVQMTPFGGHYLEIVPDEKIVYDDAWEGSDVPAMTITVTFTERDGRTTLRVETLFPSVAVKEKHLKMGMKEGFNSALDQLEALLSERSS